MDEMKVLIGILSDLLLVKGILTPEEHEIIFDSRDLEELYGAIDEIARMNIGYEVNE